MNAEIVTLDVGGRIFRTAMSTLTSPPNDGSYFARRLSGNIPPGSSYQDELGRTVYFIDRNGILFQYVLGYLRNNCLPLGKFSENPQLWRELREEAEFYALDGLCNLLDSKVTHVRHPTECGDRGVLYWLGTRRGTCKYENPYALDVVGVGGWVDSIDKAGLRALDDDEHGRHIEAGKQESRQAFVAYQPSVGLVINQEIDGAQSCCLLSCGDTWERRPVVVDFRSVRVRPTHYSIRTELCGMDTWNFEASVDGETWEALHQARGDKRLLFSNTDQERWQQYRHKYMTDDDDDDDNNVLMLAFAEKVRRGTWAISSGTFYRYFRFIGGGHASLDDDDDDNGCMHGVGFELFGDVQEIAL